MTSSRRSPPCSSPSIFPEAGQWDWRAEFTYFLEAFGKQDQLDAHLAEYDAEIADIRERWADAIDATDVSLVQFNNASGDTVIHPPTQIMLGQVVDEVGGHFDPDQASLTEPLELGAGEPRPG